MKFTSDIDIDFANRDQALALFKYTPASMLKDNKFVKHNTGVYFTDVPRDPLTKFCSIPYAEAEELGYIKIDLLNVGVYEAFETSEELEAVMQIEPPWHLLKDRSFFERVVHIGNHYDIAQRMPEPIDSIPRMAMFLSIIRPAKRHLLGLPWSEVAKTVWQKPTDGGYYFKKAHAVAYSVLVGVHMNLLKG